MTTTAPTRYDARAIDVATVAALRVGDDAGRSSAVIHDDEGGAPLRCCCRLSRPGEMLRLVSYAPLRRWAAEVGIDPGAYDEVGPVFIHAEACDGMSFNDLPGEFFAQHRMLRAYRRDGSILGARLVTPQESPAAMIEEVFTDADIAVIHVRAVEFGCFLLEVRRNPEARASRRP